MMRLYELRKRLHLSQSEVASNIGCSANVYSRYERGEREPSIDMLISMSKFFDVSIDYLVGSNNECVTLNEHEKEFYQLLRDADEQTINEALDFLKKNNDK